MTPDWLKRDREEPKGFDINKPLPVGDRRVPLPPQKKTKTVPYKRSPREAGMIDYYRRADPYGLRPQQM